MWVESGLVDRLLLSYSYTCFEEASQAEEMGYLRDLLLYLEPALLPELATYETEIFAATAVVSLLTFVREFDSMTS